MIIIYFNKHAYVCIQYRHMQQWQYKNPRIIYCTNLKVIIFHTSVFKKYILRKNSFCWISLSKFLLTQRSAPNVLISAGSNCHTQLSQERRRWQPSADHVSGVWSDPVLPELLLSDRGRRNHHRGRHGARQILWRRDRSIPQVERAIPVTELAVCRRWNTGIHFQEKS